MKKINLLFGLVLISAFLLIAACTNDDNNNDDSAKDALDNTEETKSGGDEKLISVRGEYTYCYSTPENYDPTNAFECVENITYKECLEWKKEKPGEGHTFFYAVFQGGEPTIVGRNANNYFMKVKYGDNLELEDDGTAFPNRETVYDAYDLTDCYPAATIEMYDREDNLVAKKSFDNTNN